MGHNLNRVSNLGSCFLSPPHSFWFCCCALSYSLYLSEKNKKNSVFMFSSLSFSTSWHLITNKWKVKRRKDKHRKFKWGNYFVVGSHGVLQKLSGIPEGILSGCSLPCLKSEQMPLPASHLFGHVQGHPMVFVWDLFACFNRVADCVDENLLFNRDLSSPTDLLHVLFPFPKVCF